MEESLRRILCGLTLLLSFVFLSTPLQAQQEWPTIRGLLTGYAAVGYATSLEGERENNFSALTSLVPLFQIEEDLLIAAEVEFALHDSETLVVLEHAEVSYLGFERVQLRAGKFHLPFGMWMHANWVNKMPTPPLLYEDTHGGAATNALMPILFDLGAIASWNVPLADGWRTTADFWVSQGPRPGVAGGHGHGDEDPRAHHGEQEPADAAPLAYGSNYEDNNSDKMLGLRLRAVSMAGVTVQGSGFRAAYDDAGDLMVRGANLSVAWTPRLGSDPLFHLRVEGTLLRQDYVHHGSKHTVESSGYYTQLSRAINSLEPVIRWSFLPEAIAGHGALVQKRRQLAVGLNYWMSPSVPIKAAYHWELDGADALAVEWALGF